MRIIGTPVNMRNFRGIRGRVLGLPGPQYAAQDRSTLAQDPLLSCLVLAHRSGPALGPLRSLLLKPWECTGAPRCPDASMPVVSFSFGLLRFGGIGTLRIRPWPRQARRCLMSSRVSAQRRTGMCWTSMRKMLPTRSGPWRRRARRRLKPSRISAQKRTDRCNS